LKVGLLIGDRKAEAGSFWGKMLWNKRVILKYMTVIKWSVEEYFV